MRSLHRVRLLQEVNDGQEDSQEGNEEAGSQGEALLLLLTMPTKKGKPTLRVRAKLNKGVQLVCYECGTRVLIDCCGASYQKLICCGKPMKTRS